MLREGKEKGERFKILQEIAEYQLNVLNAAEEIKMIESDGALSEVWTTGWVFCKMFCLCSLFYKGWIVIAITIANGDDNGNESGDNMTMTLHPPHWFCDNNITSSVPKQRFYGKIEGKKVKKFVAMTWHPRVYYAFQRAYQSNCLFVKK